MPASQVPVWLPIFVGVIGVAGVLAGQLIGAWREDKRWTREWEREKARWQREDNDHWKDVRLDYYIQYIGVMNRWSDLLISAIEKQFLESATDAAIFARMKECQDEADVLVHAILVVGSRVTQEECHGLSAFYGSSRHALESGTPEFLGEKLPQDQIADALYFLIDTIRDEFGFDSITSTTGTHSLPDKPR